MAASLASLESSSYFAHLYGSSAALENSSANMLTLQSSNSSATEAIIVNLVFANTKSWRTSTIVLAAFNALAAFATAFSIIYDSWWAQSRRHAVLRYKTTETTKKFSVSQMHPAETFPLILNIGIGAQSLIFAGIQGTGLHSLFIDGCSTISQVMFPAIFIVPYIEIIFGLECMRRACSHKPFQPRGKYTVTICLVLIALMLIGTWVPIHIKPERDHCFASLLWFISGMGRHAFILLAVSIGVSVVSAITICMRLSTFTLIDQHQRIAASRMVYYLILGSVTMAFIIQFFALMWMKKASMTSSMIATVVLNLSGLLTGLLQLFLRSNTAKSSFKPKRTPNWSGDKHDIRLFGPNELGFGGHLLQPVSGPGIDRSESKRSILNYEKDRRSVESIRSPPPTKSPQRSPTYYKPFVSDTNDKPSNLQTNSNSDSNMPIVPEPAAAGSSAISHSQQRRYSLYPTEESKVQLPATTFNNQTVQPAQSKPSLPVPQSKFQSTTPTSPFFTQIPQNTQNGSAPEIKETFFGLSSSSSRPEASSVYSMGALLPPPSFLNNTRHRRNSSQVSMATVQIGLRLSHAQPELQPPSPDRLVQILPPLPSTIYPSQGPFSTAVEKSATTFPLKPVTIPSSPVPKLPMKSPLRPSPLAQTLTRGNSSKTLPPTPRPKRQTPPIEEDKADQETIIQLSPSVYSPKKSPTAEMSMPPIRSDSRTGTSSSQTHSPTRSNPLGRKDSQRTQRRYQGDGDDETIFSASASSSRSSSPTCESADGSRSKNNRVDWI